MPAKARDVKEDKPVAVVEVDEPLTEPAAEQVRAEVTVVPGECVVDDGTPHMGRAVNGLVCSAHAMHYRPDGNPRGQ